MDGSELAKFSGSQIVVGSVFVTGKLLIDYWIDSLYRSSLRGVPHFVFCEVVVFG